MPTADSAGRLDVLAHDRASAPRRQPVPLALLPERVDEQVLAGRRAHLEALLLGVLGLLGHRQVRMGRLGPAHQPALREHDVELVDVAEPGLDVQNIGPRRRACRRARRRAGIGRRRSSRRRPGTRACAARARPGSRRQAGIDLEERELTKLRCAIDPSRNSGGHLGHLSIDRRIRRCPTILQIGTTPRPLPLSPAGRRILFLRPKRFAGLPAVGRL